jgi:hypothetical protein
VQEDSNGLLLVVIWDRTNAHGCALWGTGCCLISSPARCPITFQPTNIPGAHINQAATQRRFVSIHARSPVRDPLAVELIQIEDGSEKC